jgi:L-threonylcarbamoyladenylate synthase
MAETFVIKQGPRAKLGPVITRSAELMRDGKVLVIPLENGYVFLCDAFNHAAVQRIHILRGDEGGVACQVLVGSAAVAAGITIDFDSLAKSFAEKFWPGLLTLNLPVQRGITWNLGDDRSLDLVSVRVPSNKFALELVKSYGPLAIGSAARIGMPPTRETLFVPALDSDIGATIDFGELPVGAPTTVLTIANGAVKVDRIGAISLKELKSVNKNIVITP